MISYTAFFGVIGARTIATHLYYSNGWRRDKVYPQLGFDEMYFLKDYPQSDLIRDYVNDQECFEYLISMYETEKDDNLFIFCVTMQNHGGYEDESYKSEIEIDGLNGIIS